MKVIMRFNKLGSMMYIGHLDLMRYFQKLFRRSGLDVSYSKGFNPHQLMSFASPLGLGLTSIGEYLDVSLESLNYNGFDNERCGAKSYTTDEWIDIINSNSNGLVNITSFDILPDNAKPSMSMMAAASYRLLFDGADGGIAREIVEFFRNSDEMKYIKKTKKSEKEIDLCMGILAVADDYDDFAGRLSEIAETDEAYERECLNGSFDELYIMCIAGSVLNIKPEMLVEKYMQAKGIKNLGYEIMRLDIFRQEGRYVSMSVNKVVEE